MTETTPAIVPSEPLARTLIGVPEGHGAPHHDAGQIKTGDFVVQVDRNGDIRHGIAHRQDRSGDWATEDGEVITWDAVRADRPDAVTIWPAPPAEEVELPTEFGAVITDVEMRSGEQYDRMVYTECFWAYDAASYESKYVAAFTLPDGTRARRDGERFIKVQEEEK